MKISLTAFSVNKALWFPVCAFFSVNALADGVVNHDIVDADTLANNTQFDPVFINSSFKKNIDLKQFSIAGNVPEGDYQADVYINEILSYSERVKFRRNKAGKVVPCLSESILKHLHLKENVIKNKVDFASCPELSNLIPGSSVKFDASSQRLDISVPQKFILHLSQGEVPESEWDSGIAAAFVGYNFNTYESSTHGSHYNSDYLGLNSGMNIGGWFFRHNGTWTSQTNQQSRYHALNTYVQHDINGIKGRVVIGQSNTSGRLFDTLPFTGVSVMSDDQMLPQSRRGYAPEIRGVANTSAKVTVRQGDQVIYETTVSPGEFILDDLYPSGYGGDLVVSVREADGQTKTFRVPYSSVADLLRPGVQRYEIVAGKYRNDYSSGDGNSLYQFTWQRGISNYLTFYTGSQKSNDYFSGLLGVAIDTPIGAFGTDITHSITDLDDSNKKGESYRISYNKLIQESGSNIALAAYRFSTRGYFDFTEAMHYQDLYNHHLWAGDVFLPKSKFIISVQQKLGEDLGQLYVSNIWLNSWGNQGSEKQYQLGYSNYWKKVSYSFSLNRSRLDNGQYENNWLLSASIPLGEESNTSLSTSLGRDSSGHYTEQVGLSGSEGESGQLSWNAQGSHTSYGDNMGSLSGQYRSPVTNIGVGASAGENTHTLSGNLSGAIVGHRRGVTLTPYLADSYVVVSAPGATGAKLPGYSDVRIDRWGNAVVPVWSPYSVNEIRIDPKGIPTNIELDETSQATIPRAGAVTQTIFSTHKGYPLLFSPQDHHALPFGSNVTDEHGQAMGLVSQGGQIYLRATEESGKLYATWNDNGSPKTCIISYALHENELTLPMIKRSYQCQ
ncbi:TPA: fimbrial biogenesis outer membrane usher protein [Klebsiella quasipneumoniae subsp. quasipneumoniae]|nr:fimbrial biogenesis outer membrane usher protein [Klebsiella quasipneumoniae subsp. quasipneumoniae]